MHFENNWGDVCFQCRYATYIPRCYILNIFFGCFGDRKGARLCVLNIFSFINLHHFEFICRFFNNICCGILIISGPLIAQVWRINRMGNPKGAIIFGSFWKPVINKAHSSTWCTKAFLTLAIFLLRTPAALRGNKKCISAIATLATCHKYIKCVQKKSRVG